MSSYSRRSRCDYSRSPSPYYRRRKSVSPARSPGRSRSRESSVENPGNNLYVTGLSSRVTRRGLEKHFAAEGDVVDVHLVTDPWTGDSRGFGFVTMATLKDADRCLKYLDGSVLEGRVITVEKRARRRRGRTPTPGRYLGARTAYEYRRSPSYSPYYRRYDDSPGHSSERESSYSPHYRRRRYRSRSRSPYDRYSRSPSGRRHRRSYSPDHYSARDRSESPYYRRRRNYRSVSRSASPRYRRISRRSYSRSVSPGYRRSRRSYSPSVSPRAGRSPSRSCSPPKKRSPSRSSSPPKRGRGYSRESYSHSRSRSRSRSSPSPSRSAGADKSP